MQHSHLGGEYAQHETMHVENNPMKRILLLSLTVFFALSAVAMAGQSFPKRKFSK